MTPARPHGAGPKQPRARNGVANEGLAAHKALSEGCSDDPRREAIAAGPVYVFAMAGAELVTVFFGTMPGLCANCLLLFAMLNHYLATYLPFAHWQTGKDARSLPGRVLPVLALAPLMRILSLVMPLQDIPQAYWYALIGAPMLVAALLAARHLDLSLAVVGFPVPRWRCQIAIAATGIPLGLVGFLLVHPEPLTPSFQWGELAIGSAVLVVFVGFTEELIFRALLLPVAPYLGGRIHIPGRIAGRVADHFEKVVPVDRGIFWSSAVFAIMSIGSGSLPYVVFVGLIGMFFSWCVRRTGSIWGVVAAHSALVMEALLILPHVFG